jgi:D-inositol-3-phosphate glycosyltransferase
VKKVLILADSPTCITGFGKVAKHICKTLHDSGAFEIAVVGINYDGTPANPMPYEIVPATSALVPQYREDLYGRAKTIDILRNGAFDIFFCIQDMGVAATFMPKVKEIQDALPPEKKFVSIFYTPVDSHLTTQKEWVRAGLEPFDFPVTYTEYGKKEILKVNPLLADRIDICPHGVDTEDFHPMPPDKIELFKRNGMNRMDFRNKFIVLNVNRNQIRKDYLRTFKAFAELKAMVPSAFLLVIAQLNDQGGDLLDMARQCGLEYGRDWLAPADYIAAKGYSVQTINMCYNIADVVFSTTVGEGWGLSSTEAMAVGKPCVFPDNTSLNEIFGGGERGYLVPCGSNPDQWVCHGHNDSSLVRPAIDVREAAKALKYVFDHPKEAAEKARKGQEWAYAHTWDSVNEFWVKKFAEAGAECERRRSIPTLMENGTQS